MRVFSLVICIAALLLEIVEPIAAKEVAVGEPLLRYIDLGKRAPIPEDDSDSDDDDDAAEVDESWPSGSTPPFDEQRFNDSATTSCPAALEPMQRVVNPSGLVACYNVPFFDNSTGTFVADIRLFQVSDPEEQFAGVPWSEYALQVMIPQATLSNARQVAGDDKSNNGSDGNSTQTMLKGFQNVGQLNSQLQIEKLSLYAPPCPFSTLPQNTLEYSIVISN